MLIVYYPLWETSEESPQTNPDFIPKHVPTKYSRIVSSQNSDFEREVLHEYTTEQHGYYRIQNINARGYLLYVGINGFPDLTKPEQGFSATLPLSLNWPLPGSENQTLFVVPRYRDSYGCVSQNSYPKVIVLSPSGEVFPPLPTPQSLFATPKSNMNLSVMGLYPEYDISEHPGDRVRIWVGTSPPDTSLPHTYQGPLSGPSFAIDFGSYSVGLYYLVVAFYRTADSALSGFATTTVTVPPIPNDPEAVFTENVTPP